MTKHLGIVAGALAVAVLSSAAHASISAFLTNTGTTTWDYTLSFQPITGETLVAGDFVTIYDFQPSTEVGTVVAPSGWSFTTQAVGTTPTALNNAAGLGDDPNVENITFVYNGAPVSTATNFSASIDTKHVQLNTVVSDGAGVSTLNFGKVSTQPLGDAYATLFPVLVPTGGGATPEPASLALAGIGALALLARRRRA